MINNSGTFPFLVLLFRRILTILFVCIWLLGPNVFKKGIMNSSSASLNLDIYITNDSFIPTVSATNEYAPIVSNVVNLLLNQTEQGFIFSGDALSQIIY